MIYEGCKVLKAADDKILRDSSDILLSCGQGACCDDLVCTIETEDNCTTFGGTYQGDDTTCTPDPCAGTCCWHESNCLINCGPNCGITDLATCNLVNGTFLGPGFPCIDDPCCGGGEDCGGCCYQGNFGEGCYKYVTTSYESHSNDCPVGCSSSVSSTRTSFQDPDNGCFEVCVSASGSSNCTGTVDMCACCGDEGLNCSASISCGGISGGCGIGGTCPECNPGDCNLEIVSDTTTIYTCDSCLACPEESSGGSTTTTTFSTLCGC